jgi:ATP-dependent Clp protease protease subunit
MFASTLSTGRAPCCNGGTTSTAKVYSTEMNEVYFIGDITMTSMADLICELKKQEKKAIAAYNAMKEDLPADRKTNVFVKVPAPEYIPIKLVLNSPGGQVYAALFAIDEIARMTVPVHTYISGFCASAATLLSLAGKKRYISKHSYMLIHEVRAGFWGKKSSVTDDYENISKLSELLVDLYAEKTKMTREELPAILERDRNWDAKECLEKGLVDEIL